MSRIAFIAGYQGPGIIEQRNIQRNLALAGSRKIALIARLLMQLGHDPVIISEACSAERSCRFFRRFSETVPGLPGVVVKYACTVDIRFLNVILSGLDVILLLFKECKQKKIDCVIVYNFGLIPIIYIVMAKWFLRVPVFLEYEDDAWVDRGGGEPFYHRLCKCIGRLARQLLSGCFAVSQRLIDQIGNPNSFLVRGIVADSITGVYMSKKRENVVLYSGSMDNSKGVDHLVQAWQTIVKQSDWKLVLTGDGEAAAVVCTAAKSCSSIEYLGVVTYDRLVELLSIARIGVNPHRMTSQRGNVFPFKVIEYLAGGLTVLSTPMLEIEEDLQSGILFSESDSAIDIAKALQILLNKPSIQNDHIAECTIQRYGEPAIMRELNKMLLHGGVGK